MKYIIPVLFFVIYIQVAFSQNYQINTYNGQTVTTCAGTFYDSGGQGGNYSLGENYSISFCPSTPGQKVSLTFTSFDIDGTNNNVICFYDGVGTSGTYYGCNSNLDNLGLPFSVTSNDALGCLTVTFNSTAAIATGTGWSANITCTYPCQPVIAVLDHTAPPSSGNYVDICPGDSVTFYAMGSYPQNGLAYTQSDATSTFLWNFGDGSTATGTTVTHVFNTAGGYDVNLKVTDVHGCHSPNDIGERVRVSTTPVFAGTNANPDTICIGETSTLTGIVTGTTWSNIPPNVVAGTTFLPDGVGTPYTTTLNYDCFNPGQTIANATDILQMCASMEHSYLGDLTITLSCPNGNYVTLIQYPNGCTNTYLGVPIDNDANLNPGTGWTYCWSPNGPQGTMPSNAGGTMAASPPNYSETGEGGHTFQSLVGCPLNGDWTITVLDNLNSDNGYIFWWSLDFDPTLYPSSWSFTPTYQNTPATQYWTGTGITGSGSTVTVQPTSAGIQTYTFTAVDNAGCSYDTVNIKIYVRPQSDPLCCIPPIANAGFNDLSCGLSYQLNASLATANSGMWSVVSGPGTGLFSNPTQPDATVSVSAFGTYTFKWRETYNPACKDSDEVTINFTNVTITMTTQDITCNGYDNGRATVNVTSGLFPYSYLWSNGGSVPTLSGLEPGQITVVVTDAYGCDTSATGIIYEPLPFNITPSPDIHLCYGESQFIYANPNGGTPPYRFFWNGVLDSASIYVGPLVDSAFIVRAEDANGCRSDTFKITVWVDPPLQLQVIQSDDTVCPGEPVLITTVIYGGDGGPYYVYLNNEGIQHPPFKVYPQQTTEYIIIARDRCGSYGVRDTITVVTYSLPPINFHSDIHKGCQPLRVTFNEENDNPGASYLWYFGEIDENNTSSNRNPIHTFDLPGLYDVSLLITSWEGCVDTLTIEEMIEVYPKPNARFINTPSVVSIINPLIYFDNLSSGAVNYYWAFGDGDSSEYISPQHYYSSVNTFIVSLIAENAKGCQDTNLSTILVKDEYTFFAPSAFSPDKDGINDIFNVYGHGIDPKTFQMYIYDRWGAIVFQTQDMNQGWNGLIKGNTRNVVKSGVYTWYVIYKDLSGIEHQERGPVTLIH
ncbi:MAG: PKD domain-containing protein [Bacteroidia bacterium]|nr:PKD domain-containing protein [Bacteroidia bacterium]